MIHTRGGHRLVLEVGVAVKIYDTRHWPWDALKRVESLWSATGKRCVLAAGEMWAKCPLWSLEGEKCAE